MKRKNIQVIGNEIFFNLLLLIKMFIRRMYKLSYILYTTLTFNVIYFTKTINYLQSENTPL